MKHSTAQHMPNCSNKKKKTRSCPVLFREHFILWNVAAWLFFVLGFFGVCFCSRSNQRCTLLAWPKLQHVNAVLNWNNSGGCQFVKHIHTQIPGIPGDFPTSYSLYSTDLLSIDLLFDLHVKEVKLKNIVFPDANLQQLLAPGSFPYPCDLFIPWDLAGWEASSLSPTGLFAVASWQTAGGAHFDRMFHWHRGWLDRIGGLIEPPVEVGRPTFAAFRKRTVKTRRRNYFKRFQYLRASRALVGAQ